MRALYKSSFIIIIIIIIISIIIIIIIRNGRKKAGNMITVLIFLQRQPYYGTRVYAQILFYTFLRIIYSVRTKKDLHGLRGTTS